MKKEAAAKIHGRAESVKAWEQAFLQARQALEMERKRKRNALNQQQILKTINAEKAFKRERDILEAQKENIKTQADMLEQVCETSIKNGCRC